MGVIIDAETNEKWIRPALEALKSRYFEYDADEPLSLHRKELVNRSGAFWRLRDPDTEKRFNQDLLDFFSQNDYCLIAIVIDKVYYAAQEAEKVFNPYQYGLAVLLERYCQFLHSHASRGDVYAEARGGREDQSLKISFQNVYELGDQDRPADFFQSVLTSKSIKLAQKYRNITGLQMADLLAHPCRQEILALKGKVHKDEHTFGAQLVDVIQSRYFRNSDGEVDGFGRVFLGEK